MGSKEGGEDGNGGARKVVRMAMGGEGSDSGRLDLVKWVALVYIMTEHMMTSQIQSQRMEW